MTHETDDDHAQSFLIHSPTYTFVFFFIYSMRTTKRERESEKSVL